MNSKSIILGCLAGAVLGALPGVLIAVLVLPKVGVSVAALGAVVGALLAVPGTSLTRVMKMTATMIVARNIPLSDRAYDWIGKNEAPPDETTSFSDTLLFWAVASDVSNRRGRIVAAGLVIGLIAGGAIAAHDVLAIHAGERGLVLPFEHTKDSLTVQVGLLTIASSIWSGVAAAVIAAPAYRRPLLLAVPFAAFIAFMIASAADTSRGGGPLGLVIMISSAAALVALFVAACGFEIHDEGPPIVELETVAGRRRFTNLLKRAVEAAYDARRNKMFLDRYSLHVLFYSIFLVAAGLSLFVASRKDTLTALASSDWPAVEGVVTRVVARHVHNRHGFVKYYGRAIYEYTIDDKVYSSELMDFSASPKRRDQFAALRDVSWYTPGMELPVYYDPADPSVAVLVTGADSVRLSVFVASIVMAIVGTQGLVVSIWHWRRSRAQKAAYLNAAWRGHADQLAP